MSTQPNKIGLVIDKEAIKNRDIKHLDADKNFVANIAQGAINVELFTIPLYMTSMYSIVGVHQINSKGTNFYESRWWPGSGASNLSELSECQKKVKQSKANQKAFNGIFSVFMEEMLHLQLAANITSKLGVDPDFTKLQKDGAWTCYGEESSSNGFTPSKMIPHIIDFNHCKDEYAKIDVKLDTLNTNQIKLFQAIEESETSAEEKLKPEDMHIYQHKLPLDETDWTKESKESDLPLFGTISFMYEALWAYLEIEYTNGTSLLEELFKARKIKNKGVFTPSIQRDQFNDGAVMNTPSGSMPIKEYPHMYTKLKEDIEGETIDIKILKNELLNMINGITDQGEGKGVISNILQLWSNESNAHEYTLDSKQNSAMQHPHAMGHPQGMPPSHMNLTAVKDKFQPDPKALKMKYKGYNDKGDPIDISGQAKARIDDAPYDHFETFVEVEKNMKEEGFLTWDMWHKEGNKWEEEMLQEPNYIKESKYNIPTALEVKDALNEVKEMDIFFNEIDKSLSSYDTLSLAALGTINSLTQTLNEHWSKEKIEFPKPAMGGSGDRVSICWAITGKAPKLWSNQGITKIDTHTHMYNACQGMSLTSDEINKNFMPDVRIFHNCKGSNMCKTQGGCGFVHSTTKGGSCSGTVKVQKDDGGLVSAPANNMCGGRGGCAVPISASQLFPSGGTMQIYTHSDPSCSCKEEKMEYKKGDSVYDIAWKAYEKSLEGQEIETSFKKPKAHPLRVAFPPST